MLELRKKKAQSTLEYLLILTAIVGVIVFAAARLLKPKVEGMLTNTSVAIGNVGEKLQP